MSSFLLRKYAISITTVSPLVGVVVNKFTVRDDPSPSFAAKKINKIHSSEMAGFTDSSNYNFKLKAITMMSMLVKSIQKLIQNDTKNNVSSFYIIMHFTAEMDLALQC